MMKTQKIEHIGNYVYISREARVVKTTYSCEFYDELCSMSWSISGNYLRSSKHAISLHRYIISKYYGTQMLNQLTKEGLVIDHLDNDPNNCTIENLYFLYKNENTAKGLTVDKYVDDVLSIVGVGIFRSFETGLFQITLGFNLKCILTIGKSEQVVSNIYLLYDSDYTIVLNDYKYILLCIKQNIKVELGKLNHIDIRFDEIPKIDVPEGLSPGNFFYHEGEYYLVIGGNTLIKKRYFDAKWIPSE
jgi:hypothetical protein